MYYRKYQEKINRGEEGEELFKKLARKMGFKCRKATERQNKREHIDFILTNEDGEKIKVDVKTRKRYGFIAEYKNNYGYEGWIYGSADYIAEVLDDDSVHFYNRQVLFDAIYQKTKFGEVYSSEQGLPHEPYVLYTRRENYGWKDLWIIVPDEDLKEVEASVWH